VAAVSEAEWSWDPSLYAGSAAYYARGRVPYPDAVADSLAAALHLDGSGRLLDVGCGPGSLTLLLAPMLGEATGIDADRDMLSEAARLAAEAGVRNVSWRQLRAEDLPAGLGTYRLVTFARSFHWMDRSRVAAAVRGMLDHDGACVHVHAATHQGAGTGSALPHPQPPRSDIAQLVHRYLGPTRRAGHGWLPHGRPTDAERVYRAAGFAGPRRIEVPGRVVTRATDDVIAAVFSRSSSAPHLFGDQRPAFVTELRQLLRDASPTGLFSQPVRAIALDIWRP
jgi:SAM-dependent methyltransferase